MFGCYDTVTLFRRIKTESGESFETTLIRVKCKWRSRENSIATENGAIKKRYITVVIPRENGYVFDGKVGDYMALGKHKTKITGEKPYRVNDVKDMLKPDFFQIQYIKDYTNLTVGRRWKVEGIV